MIKGIFEVVLEVADLDRSVTYYEQVMKFQLGGRDDARRFRLYWVGGQGNGLLGLIEKKEESIKNQHVAFRVTPEDMNSAIEHLKQHQVEVYNIRKDGSDQPLVFGWAPSLNIYFKDPDGHELEFTAILPDSPKPEVGVVSLEEWESLHGRS